MGWNMNVNPETQRRLDATTSLVQDAAQGRAVMNMATSLWGLLCSEVTSPPRLWFSLIVRRSSYGRGCSNPGRNERFFSSPRRPYWALAPF
jgi:hypothetical protein